MDSVQEYKIQYTAAAMSDIEEKADYISLQLKSPAVSERWYFRLRTEICEDLSTLPFKYPVYDVAPWNECGIRQLVLSNDVVLYSVDESAHVVYIRAVCTKGRDLSAHLHEQE